MSMFYLHLFDSFDCQKNIQTNSHSQMRRTWATFGSSRLSLELLLATLLAARPPPDAVDPVDTRFGMAAAKGK